jgi:phage terminase large subunit-like protein
MDSFGGGSDLPRAEFQNACAFISRRNGKTTAVATGILTACYKAQRPDIHLSKMECAVLRTPTNP